MNFGLQPRRLKRNNFSSRKTNSRRLEDVLKTLGRQI